MNEIIKLVNVAMDAAEGGDQQLAKEMFRQLITFSFNLMGKGNVEGVIKLVEALRKVLNSPGVEHRWLDMQVGNRPLVCRTQILLELLATVEKEFTLGWVLPQLAGERHWHRRHLLLKMHGRGKPVKPSEMRPTRWAYTLLPLRNMGLVRNTLNGYVLTDQGMAVCVVLRQHWEE